MEAQPIEILKVLNLLKVAFPHIERDRSDKQIEDMFALYVEMLIDLDLVALKVAARQLIAECKWFPSIGELRDRVLSLSRQASGAMDWTQAWEDVNRVVRALGYEEAMRRDLHVFANDDIEMAVRRIGWRDICLCDVDQVNTMRAQFRDIYNALMGRAERDARMLPETRAQISTLAKALDARTPRAALGARHD